MKRVLEPELMEEDEQAIAYGEADFDAPNSAFVELFGHHFPDPPTQARVVDLGCGPADISLRFARRFPSWQIDAVDGSAAMLRFARSQLGRDPAGARVRLVQARIPDPALTARGYDVLVSNSLLHHLPDPLVLWRELVRVGRAGAPVLVMDLARPADESEVERIVEQYSVGEPEVLRRDFRYSLRAAFEPAEVRAQLDDIAPGLRVERVSDRHLLVWGRIGAQRAAS